MEPLDSPGPMTAKPESPDELDTKIMRSSAWALLGYGGSNALSLVTTVVLARFLVPEDFGLVALALAILAVADFVQESGMSGALIIERVDLRRAAATVAVFSPLVGAALCGLAIALAPLFERVFDAPRLAPVMAVLSVMLLLRGLSVMPMALLERDMRFGAITTVEVAGGTAQAGTSIVLGIAGAGVWSLVAGQIAFVLVRMVGSWAFSPMRPRPKEAQMSTLRRLARFGRPVTLANLVAYGNANAERVIVGRTLGTAPLGLYGVAARFGSMPETVIANIVGRGVFAAMARLRDEPDRFRRVWLDNIQRIAVFAVPANIGLAIVAQPLVLSLLGETWKEAAIPLQILALNGLFRSFGATSGEVFMALERPHYRLVVVVGHLGLLVPALIIGTRWGLGGAAGAVVAVSAVTGLASLYIVMRLTSTSVAVFLRATARPMAAWIVLAVVMLGLQAVVDPRLPTWATLVVLVTVGVATYVAAAALFAREILARSWQSLRGARARP